ncbi:hypothetical protein AT302_10700 [Pandoraea norimbergensis]|uniref:Magnesium chelatase ChlI-like catalytic domain-containing protein n=1 Tax=Pandoraea norimbergensis TaxID=93219 RepID=A0ABN4JH74_9BURK|nr:hypothetical protein AT302_10700 [Pandoraea norimbergensis]
MASAVAASPGERALVLPAANAQEAALVETATVYGARTLLDVCAHLAEGEMAVRLTQARVRAMPNAGSGGVSETTQAELPNKAGRHGGADGGHQDLPDVSDIKGQDHAKRALEVAAAGGHHLLLHGPPGTGKSMLAMRLTTLLPPLSAAEAVEVATLASLSATGFDVDRWGVRPFRAPHHTASAAALVGGGCHFSKLMRLSRNKCDEQQLP